MNSLSNSQKISGSLLRSREPIPVPSPLCRRRVRGMLHSAFCPPGERLLYGFRRHNGSRPRHFPQTPDRCSRPSPGEDSSAPLGRFRSASRQRPACILRLPGSRGPDTAEAFAAWRPDGPFALFVLLLSGLRLLPSPLLLRTKEQRFLLHFFLFPHNHAEPGSPPAW